jgi:hypothetical protein
MADDNTKRRCIARFYGNVEALTDSAGRVRVYRLDNGDAELIATIEPCGNGIEIESFGEAAGIAD